MDLSFYQALGLAMPALGSLMRASDIVGPTKRQRCMGLLSAALASGSSQVTPYGVRSVP